MNTVAAPTVIHNGFPPYRSMLSVPYITAVPHTLVYYEADAF